jgi:hypothetical protein
VREDFLRLLLLALLRRADEAGKCPFTGARSEVTDTWLNRRDWTRSGPRAD